MSLKLFRSTGFSSILSPGEARMATHPGWAVLVVSVWVGFVCNVALWRELWALPKDGPGLAQAVTLGVFVGAACAMALSLLGWRKTFKLAATVIIFVAALMACADWSLAPLSWPSLFGWQVLALLMVLGVAPTVWLWNTRVRRLPGPQQFGVNIAGLLAGAALLGASGLILFGST